MRISACICAYYEPEALFAACLKQFPPWVEKILVLVSEEPWKGTGSQHSMEMMRYLVSHPDTRLEVRRMNWRTEQEQRNWGMGRLADSDWVLIVDVDEFFTPEDWEKLRVLMTTVGRGTPCIAAKEMNTYWKDMDHIWEPKDNHRPIIAANPLRAVFFDKRCISEQMMFIAEVTLEHLSWVKKDEEVLRKISAWMHANDFDKEKWYTDVWKAWTPGMKGLRPYGAESETVATPHSLPQSIRNLFS